MHPLSGALHLPYVQARVNRGALVAHRHSLAPPRCRNSQYHRTFVPFPVSLCNDLSDPVFVGVGLACSILSILFYLFSFSSFHGLVVLGWGLSD